MARRLIRLTLGVVILALAYGIFAVDMGGKPMSAHLAEIWRSPTVQQKVRMVEHSLPNPFASKAPPAVAPAPAPAAAPVRAPVRREATARVGERERPASPQNQETSDADRRALDALVHKVQKKR